MYTLNSGKENVPKCDVQNTHARATDIEVRQSVKRNAAKREEIQNKLKSLGTEGLGGCSRNKG